MIARVDTPNQAPIAAELVQAQLHHLHLLIILIIYLLLLDTTSLVGVICQSTSLVALLGTLSEGSGQLSSVVGGVDVVQEGGVCKVGIDDVLGVDEEVLGGT